MATATAPTWTLVEAACTICESETEVVDTKLELADGVRVRVCRGCTEALATAHKLESAAAEALLAQSRREMQAREAMLADRDGQLAQQRSQLESLGLELERLRAEAERRQNAVGTILAAAQELT
jgi:chromosome segregation ATPase